MTRNTPWRKISGYITIRLNWEDIPSRFKSTLINFEHKIKFIYELTMNDDFAQIEWSIEDTAQNLVS